MLTRPTASPPLEIVAHRGASVDAPENTLPAIELAWEQQAHAVEIDVQVSRDGRLVAIHDATTDRTTGHPGKVCHQDLAELKRLDAGARKDARFAGTHIPTLQEVLNSIPDGKRVFVEVKCGLAALPDLERTLSENNLRGTKVVLIAFSLPLLRQTRQTLPHVPAYWICDIRNTPPTARQRLPHRLLHLADRAGIQGLDLSACDLVDVLFTESIRNAGLHLGVWTVDEAAMARRMWAAGVDSLTTNRPGWIAQQLQSNLDT